jgi:hypothetical protein
MQNNVWPFCLASHTSSWAQPCDCGINLAIRTTLGYECSLWRSEHESNTQFLKEDFLECLVKAIHKINRRLADDLVKNPLPVRMTEAEFNLQKEQMEMPPLINHTDEDDNEDVIMDDTDETGELASELEAASGGGELSQAQKIAALAVSIDDLLKVEKGEESEQTKALENLILSLIIDAPKAVQDSLGKNPHVAIQYIANEAKSFKRGNLSKKKVGNIITRAFEFTGSCKRTIDGTFIEPLCSGWSIAINGIGKNANPDAAVFDLVEAGVSLAPTRNNHEHPTDKNIKVREVIVYKGAVGNDKQVIIRAAILDLILNKQNKVLANQRKRFEQKFNKLKKKRGAGGIPTHEGMDPSVGENFKRIKARSIKARETTAAKEGKKKKKQEESKKKIEEIIIKRRDAQAIVDDDTLTKDEKMKKLNIKNGLKLLLDHANVSYTDPTTGKDYKIDKVKELYWTKVGMNVPEDATNPPEESDDDDDEEMEVEQNGDSADGEGDSEGEDGDSDNSDDSEEDSEEDDDSEEEDSEEEDSEEEDEVVLPIPITRNCIQCGRGTYISGLKQQELKFSQTKPKDWVCSCKTWGSSDSKQCTSSYRKKRDLENNGENKDESSNKRRRKAPKFHDE